MARFSPPTARRVPERFQPQQERNLFINYCHPRIGTHMEAMTLAEISDFSKFKSTDKIMTYVGISPSAY